ncbi:hypothetical protein [Dankookia sp. P2]|uniref:hypothetical protein n=1 Tax=Dankookia sp. P2 TaxID=3423955 RepID=UPI003D66D621
MLSRVGAKLATRPIRGRRPPAAARAAATASSIIASFGLSTGIGVRSAATASMQGPKAEQVKRMPFAPVPAA